MTIYVTPPLDFTDLTLLPAERIGWPTLTFTDSRWVGPAGWPTITVAGPRADLADWLLDYCGGDDGFADDLLMQAVPVPS